MKPVKPESCKCCNRLVDLSFHHLVPKKMHSKFLVRTLHSNIDLVHYGIWVCNDCHKQIHRLFDHYSLAEHYYTYDALMANQKFRKFVSWVSKQSKLVKRKPQKRR